MKLGDIEDLCVKMAESGVQGANAYTINSKRLHAKDGIVLVAVNEEVVVLDMKTGQIMQVLKPPNAQLQDGKNEEEQLKVMAMQHFQKSFICIGYSDKTIVVFDLLQEEKGASSVIAITTTQKKPIFFSYSAVDGSNDSGVLLVADKAGEVWAYDVPTLKKTVKLLGHCASVLMDMAISSDCTKLVTADRDEKIRISNFPQTVLIDTYCLGHSSVVTSIATLSPTAGDEMLLSAGWDHKIFLWNMQTGTIINQCKLASAGNGDSCSGGGSGSSGGSSGGNDEDIDEEVEKSYDETAAGNFPMRIVTYTPHSDNNDRQNKKSPLIALLMKDMPYVKVLDIDMRLEEAMTIQLKLVPSDLVFTDNGALMILMPAPIFMTVVEISDFQPGTTLEMYDGHDENSLMSAFRLYCQQKGNVNFTQCIGNVEEGGGLRKQTLDKRFLAEKILARTGVAKRSKSRGGKRRRKHKDGQEQEGTNKDEENNINSDISKSK